MHFPDELRNAAEYRTREFKALERLKVEPALQERFYKEHKLEIEQRAQQMGTFDVWNTVPEGSRVAVRLCRARSLVLQEHIASCPAEIERRYEDRVDKAQPYWDRWFKVNGGTLNDFIEKEYLPNIARKARPEIAPAEW